MSWSFTGSGLALMLRRMRGRFGISAPRVAVRTHVPWYLRTAVIGAAIVLSVILAGWAYDAGRRIAGCDRSESSQLFDELRLVNVALEEEVARLRSLLTVSESSLQIEQAAQRSLAEKNSTLVEENARLKEELVVLGRLAKLEDKASGAKIDSGKANGEISLDRLVVRPDVAPGTYRFSFLLALQGKRRGKESRLNLQITAIPRAGTTGDKIELPRQGDKNSAQYEVVLHNFRRVDGKFEVPVGISVGAVEFKISEAGVLKVSKSLNL
jgi:hypothetical protein